MSVHGGGWQSRGVLLSVWEAKDLMGLLLTSAVLLSHGLPLCRSSREKSSFRALLCLSWRRPDIERQLPAMWPLLVNCPHMEQRGVGLCARRRVLWTPQMSFCLCVNKMWVREVYLLWNEKSAPSEAALASRAQCLVVLEKGNSCV
jgi:hypothetical protein